MVITGGGICYVGFMDIAYLYRIDLGMGISSTRIHFVVYVSVAVFAGAVMLKPAG